MSSIDTLLGRLQKVRQSGPGRWMACCPAHEDGNPSLSIRALDDGRILLNDFGGCDAADIIASVGLSMSDLFPERLTTDRITPSTSRAAIPYRDLLSLIDFEALVVCLIAASMHEKKTIDQEDLDLLWTAAARIGRARVHARQ